MTTYPDNNHTPVQSATQGFSAIGQQTELSPEQISHWRSHINEYQHPVIIFGARFQPLLLNDSLRQRLSEPENITGTEEPTAFAWETICRTAGHLVAEAAQTRCNEVAQAFPLHRSCFAAVGTIIRNNAGTYIAAVINLADLTSSGSQLRELFAIPKPLDTAANIQESAQSDEYTDWKKRREDARVKMAKLSRRESQVVALVSDGFPNKSIAHELDISVKTIEKHRANATRKLGVSSTPEMVRIAVNANVEAPGRRKADDDTTLGN